MVKATPLVFSIFKKVFIVFQAKIHAKNQVIKNNRKNYKA